MAVLILIGLAFASTSNLAAESEPSASDLVKRAWQNYAGIDSLFLHLDYHMIFGFEDGREDEISLVTRVWYEHPVMRLEHEVTSRAPDAEVSGPRCQVELVKEGRIAAIASWRAGSAARCTSCVISWTESRGANVRR